MGKTSTDNKKPANEPAPLNKKEIANNSDAKIDQDYPNFPHAPGSEELIKPETTEEKKTAAVDKKDGEKMDKPPKTGESKSYSNGSGGAFEATESVQE